MFIYGYHDYRDWLICAQTTAADISVASSPVMGLETEPLGDAGEDEGLTGENGSGGVVRSAHTDVERRYRASINVKLNELRQLVDGKDSKVLTTTALSVCLSVCLSV